MRFVPKCPIDNIPALVQIMTRRRLGDKPLFEPLMVSLLTHICVTMPQWVNNEISAHIYALYFMNWWPHMWIDVARSDLVIFVGLRPVIQILCHVLARGWGRWLRYFTEAKAEVKYRASARIRGPIHDTWFEWPVSILIMTLHPSLPFKTHKTSAKNPRLHTPKILVYTHLILPLPPVHALPTVNASTCC